MQNKEEGPSMETKVFQTFLTCTLLLSQLDDVSKTSCFKKVLKLRANQLIKELETVVDKGAGVSIDANEDLFMELLRRREKLLDKICTLDEVGLRILDKLIDNSVELQQKPESNAI